MEKKGLFWIKITLSRHSAWYHIRRRTRIFKMLCFKNEAHNQAGNLQRDMFLVHLKPSDIESLAGLLNFDLRILWRNMKTKKYFLFGFFITPFSQRRCFSLALTNFRGASRKKAKNTQPELNHKAANCTASDASLACERRPSHTARVLA